MLNQALLSFNINPEAIKCYAMGKLVRDSGVNPRQELLAEMALGNHNCLRL